MRAHYFAFITGAAAALFAPALCRCDITYIGTATIAGTALDRSGLPGNITNNAGQDTGIPNAVFGGAGSAIDYTGADDLYLMAPDRGPNNGDANVVDRVQMVRIVVAPGKAAPVAVTIEATTLLKTKSGKHYTGSSAAFAGIGRAQETLRLDPEGIRLAKDPAFPGAFWISDEYGPYILKFDHSGNLIDSFTLPPKYMAPVASADADVELKNSTGREPNRGMEGLAITPDGKTLVGLMQNALIQDHLLDAKLKRVGEFTRLITMNLADGSFHEFVYPLESAKVANNEILAINDRQFLAIERDGKPGRESVSKRIYMLDLRGATDIAKPFTEGETTYDYSGDTSKNGLPTKGAIPGVKTIAKTLFLDLLDPKYGLLSDEFPEKIEGLAWGPDFSNGDKLLIITSDNDFKPSEPTRFYAFRVSTPLSAAAVR